MRTIRYEDFSLKFHRKQWRNDRPNICQFELTFGCGLHCKHCYTDCYNNARNVKRELRSNKVRSILDKVYKRGMLWLCFTGGDPLTRGDFLELYAYAKDKGFIITLFTNAYSMNRRIAERLRDRLPFAIEITLNAVSQDLYEKITQVKGSFAKVMQGIDLILKANLPLKIKTQVMKDNLEQLPKIKQFIEKLGLRFYPSFLLYSRLNGDSAPTNLRISPREVLKLNGNKEPLNDNCDISLNSLRGSPHHKLFQCAIAGGDGIQIDPYGNLVPCNCIRKPKLNLLKESLKQSQKDILDWIRTRCFTNSSECRQCSIRDICFSCPGKALLEISDMQAPVPYFCELARFTANNS